MIIKKKFIYNDDKAYILFILENWKRHAGNCQ